MDMKNKNGSPRFYEIIKELSDLHSRKNADYAEQDNVWGNFDRVGHLMDYYNLWEAKIPSRVKVAICYQLKQLDCFLNALGKGKKMKVEGLGDRLDDIIVYGIILKILLEEGE